MTASSNRPDEATTAPDHEGLRKLAEAVRDNPMPNRISGKDGSERHFAALFARDNLREALDATAILSLLDDNDALQAEVGRLREAATDRDVMLDDAELALVEAKRALWADARGQWNLSDFKNWAVVQKIDSSLAGIRARSALHPVEGA